MGRILTEQERELTLRLFDIAMACNLGLSDSVFSDEGYKIIGDIGAGFYSDVQGQRDFVDLKDELSGASTEEIFLAFMGTLVSDGEDEMDRDELDTLAVLFIALMYETAYLK